jgi:hypothetical protein
MRKNQDVKAHGKIAREGQAWWYIPIIPANQEVEEGGLQV